MSSLLSSTPKTYPSSLLLKFDGSNNSIVFTDSSSYGNSITNYGDEAVIKTDQSKFGGSSGYFSGTYSHLSIATNSIFALGTSDFTIEFWAYPTAYPVSDLAALFETRSSASSGGLLIWLGADNKWVCYISANNNNIQRTISSINNASLNTWTHIRVTRSNGLIYFYINGILQGTTGIEGSPDNLSPSNTSPIYIGTAIDNPGSTRMYTGYIDDLRLVKGINLYRDNYWYPVPSASLSPNATLVPKLISHLLLTTSKSTGQIIGRIVTSSSYYAVSWWDGTRSIYSSNNSFARNAAGGTQIITIYPCDSSGNMKGYFLDIDVSNNELTDFKALYTTIDTIAGSTIPGYGKWTYYYYTYYNRYRWTWVPAQVIPGDLNYINVSANNLNSTVLNQLYTDLLDGDGTINIAGNPGGDSDTTSIATNKGYTVYGSTSPTVELLLNLNGSAGGTTFTDSGSNSRSITVQNGSPSLGITNKKYGTASLSTNNGSIGTTSTIIGDMSTLDFTVEAWIYKTNTTTQSICLLPANYTSSTAGISFYVSTNNIVALDNGQTASASTTTPIPTGTWTHLAGVKKENKRYIYIDGVLCNSPVDSADTNGPYSVDIGAYRVGSTWSSTGTMLIDDFRVVRGKAIYNNDFVPPSAQLTSSTASANLGTTVLLLNGNGTNNSTTFIDSGHKSLTPTRNGNTVISTAQYQYGTASIYFDGTGDYLSYNGNNFNFFNSDFTIECWIRPSSVTGARVIFSKRANTGSFSGFIFQLNGNKLNITTTNNGTSWGINLDSVNTMSINTWYHVCVTRLYNTFRIFIDGNLENSTTIDNFIISGNTDNMAIGAGSAAGGQEFYGYIDDLRIIRGACLYTSNFTRPSSELSIYPT